MPQDSNIVTKKESALSIKMRRAIEHISNIRIKTLLLNHLNISANRTTELFTQQFISDRPRIKEVVTLPYVNPLNMAFVFAPIPVCEALADILIACDEKERVKLLSETSDHNEPVLAKIMRIAPAKTRRKITTSIKALSDDNKCILLLGSRDGFISSKFVNLLNHKDSVASVDLIEALRAIERTRLLNILSQDSTPLFKSYNGIIDILQSNPPENIALAALSLLDNENDINLKKLFFGSSKVWLINSTNLVHVTLINKSDLVILKLFSLLKRLNPLDINQLLTHRACFIYKSGRYTGEIPDPVSNNYGYTPLTWAFQQPNNTNATALIIQELSKIPGMLPLISQRPLPWVSSALELATDLGNYAPQTSSSRVNLLLENRTLDTADKWWNLGNSYYLGTSGKTQDFPKAYECWNQAVELDPTHSKSFLSLGNLYLKVWKQISKAKQHYEKAASLGNYEAKKLLFIMENPLVISATQWNALGLDYYNALNGKKKDYLKARICYELVIVLDANHTNALYSLGYIYEFGLNVEKNHTTALDFYQKAVRAGHEICKKRVLALEHNFTTADGWNNLGNLYFFGIRRKDYLYAKWCYELALELDPKHTLAIENLKILSEYCFSQLPIKPKTQEYYKETMSSASHVKQQQLILEDIIASSDLAKMKFSDGSTWLHYIAAMPYSTLLDTQTLQNAIRKILTQNINPYSRNTQGKTPFYTLSISDRYEISNILRPSNFIGKNEKITEIESFFKEIKENPGVEQHLLLVAGPPGVGKSEFTKAVATQQGFKITEYPTGTKDDRFQGQVQTRIIKFFADAVIDDVPTCLIIDEIDAILPESEDMSDSNKVINEQIVTLFQKEIDKLKDKKIVLVGTTNYLDRIKKAIKSRAGTSIQFDLPDNVNRQLLVQDFLRFAALEPGSTIISKIVDATSGWSPRDLKNYINKVLSKQRISPSLPLSNELFEGCFEAVRQELEMPRKGYPKMIAPRLNISEPIQKAMPISDDILEAVNEISAYLANPSAFTKINPLYKVHTLLFGPPGGGKTEFARLIVEKSNCPCFIVDPGNSATALVNAFSQARACEKALIFIDEFDHFASTPTAAQRIQTEMDGFVKSKNTLVVIGATNYLENIMPPVLSRFGNKIEVLLPNQEQRSQFFKFSLTNLRINSPKAFDTSLDVEINNGCINLGRKTEHFSIRDLYAVLNQITHTLVKRAEGPTKDNLEPLMAILERVISKVKKAVDKEHLLPFASAANSPSFFSPKTEGLAKSSPDLSVSHKFH